jgi:hypothetical protein
VPARDPGGDRCLIVTSCLSQSAEHTYVRDVRTEYSAHGSAPQRVNGTSVGTGQVELRSTPPFSLSRSPPVGELIVQLLRNPSLPLSANSSLPTIGWTNRACLRAASWHRLFPCLPADASLVIVPCYLGYRCKQSA